MRYRTLGLIGKFQPPTLGHASLFAGAAAHADRLLIGIGSVNRYDAHRPFRPSEVHAMLMRTLDPIGASYNLIGIPDYAHKTGNSNDWITHMREEFKDVDAFVTGNPYVEQLLKEHMSIIHPTEIITPENLVTISSTMVRNAMAEGNAWQAHVPPPVARYITENDIDNRIRRSFGDVLRATKPTTLTAQDESRRITGDLT